MAHLEKIGNFVQIFVSYQSFFQSQKATAIRNLNSNSFLTRDLKKRLSHDLKHCQFLQSDGKSSPGVWKVWRLYVTSFELINKYYYVTTVFSANMTILKTLLLSVDVN